MPDEAERDMPKEPERDQFGEDERATPGTLVRLLLATFWRAGLPSDWFRMLLLRSLNLGVEPCAGGHCDPRELALELPGDRPSTTGTGPRAGRASAATERPIVLAPAATGPRPGVVIESLPPRCCIALTDRTVSWLRPDRCPPSWRAW